MACDGDGVEAVIEPNLSTVYCEGCAECQPKEVEPDVLEPPPS